MNSFSLFKSGGRPKGGQVSAFVEQCERIAEGDLSIRIDAEGLDGDLARIAVALNRAIETAEQKIDAYDKEIGRAHV